MWAGEPRDRPLRQLFGPRQRRRAESPLRAELLSVERLEERARGLAASFTLARARDDNGQQFFARVDENARVLRDAYRILADDVHRGEFLAPAGEWLLDNFHLIESEIRGAQHDLPRRYYRELPKLAPREMSGMARIYAMALELVRHTDGRLDRGQLVRFMTAYQTVAPLTIGELWAWPSMLKLALIENLRRLAEETLRGTRRAAERRPLPRPDRGRRGRRARCRGCWRPPTSCACCSGCASTGPWSPRCAPKWRSASPPRA